MGKASKALFLFSCVLVSLCASSSAQTCKSYIFSNNAIFSSCLDLPELNSFLHWNYSQTSNTMDMAFRHTGASSSKWVAWAINPQGLKMVGSQALVAYQNSSGAFHAYTSPVTQEMTQLPQGVLSFGVPSISATFENSEITIFAKLVLSSGTTRVNQVWQEGPMANGVPQSHSMSGANMKSMASLDLLTGQTTTSGGGANSKLRRKNVHGVLSAVSWGILLPVGAMMARYLKVFKAADPAWFYLHIACQSSAYAVGVAGWATGLKLGSESSGVYDLHRNIGILLFCLGTLQLFALLLRPKKDHKYRLYWNIYHHSAGYAVIILSIINVFEGLDILEPEKKWKTAYIAILIFLGSIAAVLEALTWYIVIKRKSVSSDKFQHNINGSANGVNGHGARTHQVV